MKSLFQIFIALVFVLKLPAQSVNIDPTIKVDSTAIKITALDTEYFAYSSGDNKKLDALIVSLSSVGTSTTAIEIDLTDKPHVYISLFSLHWHLNADS